jgi:phage shock protein E
MDWIVILVLLLAVGLFLMARQFGGLKESEARRFLQAGAKVIDVRTPKEFASGHVPGAVNLPLGELGERIAQHVPDKNQVLLLHCLSGGRSAMGCRVLKGLGYARAYNLGSYGRAQRIVLAARE